MVVNTLVGVEGRVGGMGLPLTNEAKKPMLLDGANVGVGTHWIEAVALRRWLRRSG